MEDFKEKLNKNFEDIQKIKESETTVVVHEFVTMNQTMRGIFLSALTSNCQLQFYYDHEDELIKLVIKESVKDAVL